MTETKQNQSKPVIGIIGGKGKMGSFFCKFFEEKGFKVNISDISTELIPEKCAEISDVVVVSVPIGITIDIIKQIGPYVKKDGLLMDVTSVKIEPVKAMLSSSKCEVIGTHPVFGPSVSSISNQTMVLCPARGKKWKVWLEKILAESGAKIKITSPKEHDKMMSLIQGIVHFSSVTICHAMKELNIDIAQSQEFSSPIYKIRMDVVGRILNQDPKLYADIEILNPLTPKALKAYLKTCNRLYKYVKKKDSQAFIQYFNEAAGYLGDFKKSAETDSNKLIEYVAKMK